MTDEKQRILVEPRGHILVITMNRPEAKNAFDLETAREMERALDLLDDDRNLRIGIVTGAGGNFSAGADLKAVARGEWAQTEKRGGFGIFRRPPLKPLIAAVEGYAVGGGFELCLSADMIVAARDARFGLPEVRYNVVAVGGALFRLQKRMPYNLVTELAMTGRFEEAGFFHRHGVVNRLTDPERALDGAIELANEILDNGPTAVWATKEIIFQSNFWNEPVGWDEQLAIAAPAVRSADSKEGLKAFAEKRKPRWEGR
ncbi:crotonase/enoyl-CoA hydratase family protein [Bradyrhizobium sp. AUGA SZCCT0431]|uniref:crotonase/enoyl-CoA hydratase family protein n=1 Tax=Bradyrhizobium sp. AUGA SZCCT0431 TaxID=2807674 RepID=UPI001BA7B0C7|nr:crotonase/enoyl-CoA hydratase family protein [Bradyrhizobium sp. AUGA SZCCT0431]MBR1146191.1 crotonase/enoyl-CoA hydratase family protein [Bradyrhizobium sp. AUGA SZCCT0431]